MFGIGFSELVVIVLAAIILIRPSDLPAVVRKLGRAYGSLKRTIRELTEIKDAFMRQVEAAAVLEDEKAKAEEKAGAEGNRTAQDGAEAPTDETARIESAASENEAARAEPVAAERDGAGDRPRG